MHLKLILSHFGLRALVISSAIFLSMAACNLLNIIQGQTTPPATGEPTGPNQFTSPTGLPLPAVTIAPGTYSHTIDTIPMPKIGVETHRFAPLERLEMLDQAGVRWVRHNALLWSNVEPEEGARNWEAVAELEKGLIDGSTHGLNVILIVRSTPPWAQKVDGFYCGPVKPEKLQAFAGFMADAVARYSAPPYNIKYWELGNEPDVAPALVPHDSVYGCWGDETDDYYGGAYYAEMLKAVYPAIKAVDPQAQVLTGGLLLDCDPTRPPEGKDCKPSRFLEGILRNGGGDYFDIVSFHGYPPYSGSVSGLEALKDDERHPVWEHRGGIVLGKVEFLREVMAAFGVVKPLMHTEGALVCPEWNADSCNPPDETFYEDQADYVVWLYVRNWAANLAGTIWYHFEGPGWRYVGMLDENQAPKPAYNALKFLIQELSGASYTGPVTQYPGARGYQFSKGERIIWVIWSPDGQTYLVSLPPNVISVFDKYGNAISLGGNNTLEVRSPIYIELTP